MNSRTQRVSLLGTVGAVAAGALALSAVAGVPAAGATTSTAPSATPAAEHADRAATTAVRNERQLRRAVQRSNATDGPDRIRLLDSVRFSDRRTRGGARFGDLDVRGELRVLGSGNTIDADGLARVFDVREDGGLVLKGITLTGGSAPTGGSGGAIRSQGEVKLKSSRITDSEVTGPEASGGAIMNDGGRLVVAYSRLARNDANRAGGAIEALEGTTIVRRSRLTGNTAGVEPGNGGALHLTGAGDVVVRMSRIAGNTATAEGGGLWNSAEGSLRVVDSLLKNNTADGAAADQGGGAIFNDGGTLTVTGTLVEENSATGAAGSGGGILNNLGSLEVTDSRLSDNDATRAGGGIEANMGTTTISRSTLDANSTGAAPGNGGAFHLTGAGTVEVSKSKVRDNTAAAEGGGLWNSSTGTLTVSDTVLTGNTAGGAAADQGGGGIFNDGGVLTVTDSRLAANTATGAAGSGGGILNNLGSLTVSDSRLSRNTAVRAGGGVETNVGVVDLSNVDMTDNSTGSSPGNGGALHLTGAAVVMWNGGVVTGNDASNEGGGLWNSSTGNLVANIDISDNTAPEGPNAYNDGGTFILNGMPIPPESGV